MSSWTGRRGGGRLVSRASIAAFLVMAGSLFGSPLSSAAEGDGSISGTLTAAGTLAPLAGVEVCAVAMEAEEFPFFCTHSDGAGQYTVAALAAGPYAVEFRPGEAGLNYVGEAWDDQPSWPDGNEILVGDGPVTGIDAEFAEGGEIHGRVVDAGTGAAVPGVTVCAFPIHTFRVWSCAGTGADGRYAVTGNEPGLHEVSFFVEDEGAEYLSQTYDGHTESWLGGDPVEVVAGEVTPNIDAALLKLGRITGRVTDAVTGLGIPGAEVCARRLDGFQENECAETGPAGEYTIHRLPPDTYRVTFHPEVFVSGPLGELELESNLYLTQYFQDATFWSEATPIVLGSGATLSGIDAALRRRDVAVAPPPLIVSTPGCKKGSRKVTVNGEIRCRKVLRCRKGTKKRKVKGRQRCVRVRKGARGRGR